MTDFTSPTKRKFAIPVPVQEGTEWIAFILPESEEGRANALLTLLKHYEAIAIVETTHIVRRSKELIYESI